MKHNFKNELENLENLFRSELGQQEHTPDADLWSGIAAQQRKANLWLKAKYYAPAVAVVSSLIIIAFLGWNNLGNDPQAFTNAQNADSQKHAASFLQTPNPQPTTNNQPSTTNNQQPTTNNHQPPTIHQFKNIPPFRFRRNMVPGTVVRFDSQKGLQYENPETGTSVHIPAGILVHQDGSPVTGEVDFHIWEYRSTMDVVASGIPMHYQDERGEFAFNTGGMFEMRVKQHDEELLLAEGKSLGMNFSPTHPQTSPSLFYLDDKQEKWLYEPTAAFANKSGQIEQQPPIVDEEVAIMDNLRGGVAPATNLAEPRRKRAVIDCGPIMTQVPTRSSPSQWVMDGVRTGYEIAFGKQSIPEWFRKSNYLSDSIMLTALDMSGLVHFVHHKDQTELFFPEDENNFFTELSGFKKGYFTLKKDGKELSTPIPDDYYEHIRIEKEVGNNYLITAVGRKGKKVELHAILVPSPSQEAMSFDADESNKQYNTLRNERIKALKKQIKELRSFLCTAPMFQTEEEWCKDPTDWMSYFAENKVAMRKRYDGLIKDGLSSDAEMAKEAWDKWIERVNNLPISKNNINRRRGLSALDYALQLTRFGAYNCDQIMMLARMGKGEALKFVKAPIFMLASGELVKVKNITLLEHESRLFFSVGDPYKNIPNFSKRNFTFIINDRNGNTFHMPADRYQKGASNKVFVLDKIGDDVQTPGDWSRVLKLIG